MYDLVLWLANRFLNALTDFDGPVIKAPSVPVFLTNINYQCCFVPVSFNKDFFAYLGLPLQGLRTTDYFETAYREDAN